jgi:branched-chain amino acid transport system ATP-binding protein
VSGATLRLRGLDAGYGALQILFGVDLAVGPGESVLVFGPNGAGKSTLMKAVVGQVAVQGGTIEYAGGDLAGLESEEIVRRGIGYVPQLANVFPGLTVEENLEMGATMLPRRERRARVNAALEARPLLAERRRQRAGSPSGGQRQVLAMARALLPGPDLLLLDEPSAGLAPALIRELFEEVRRIAATGTSILMVEQNAKQALATVDRGYVLENGRVRFEGEASRLLEDHDVAELYLGVRRG